MSLLIVVLMLAVTAQNDASVGDKDVVTVSGCVSGNHLKVRGGTTEVVADSLRASEFVLEGSKEMLRAIRKDHDGHYEEVTGTVKPRPVPTADTQIRQKELGPKTRITLGTRQATRDEVPAPVRLVVSSFRHIGDRCSER